MSLSALSSIRAARFESVRRRLEELSIDVALFSLGADLPWLTGYEAMPLERPTVLVVPRDKTPTLVVPQLEAPRVALDESLFCLRPWKDTESAVDVVAALCGPARSVAISDRAWASLLLHLQAVLSDAAFVASSVVTTAIREIKDSAEIAALKAAGQAADTVSEALLKGEIPLIGRSEREVSNEIADRLVQAGHDRVGFAIVGSGPNAASPHHDASERVIGRGETVVCDFGGTFSLGGDVGYCSDTTRTVVTGPPEQELKELYEVLKLAQGRACRAVAVGVACEEIDRVGREIIEDAGYGENFIHRIGHGIGIEEHEEPYMVAGNSSPIRPGHAFSVEPGIYLPGRLGARIEDIIVLDGDQVVACNQADHELHVVEA